MLSPASANFPSQLDNVKKMLNYEMNALTEVERKSAEVLQRARDLIAAGNKLRR